MREERGAEMGDVFVVNEIEKKIDGLKTDIGSMADGQNILLRRGYTFPERITSNSFKSGEIAVPSFSNEGADAVSYESSNTYTTIFSVSGPAILKNFNVYYDMSSSDGIRKVFFKMIIDGKTYPFAIFAKRGFYKISIDFGSTQGEEKFPLEINKCNDFSGKLSNLVSAEAFWDIGAGLVCQKGMSISMYCEKGGSSATYTVKASYKYELLEEA